MVNQKGALLAVGSTAEVYAWEPDKVLKLFFQNFSREYVHYEHTISSKAMSFGLPVPEVHQMIEVEGRHGIIFGRIDGPSILEMMFSQPDTVESLARLFAEIHAQIHRNRISGYRPLRDDLTSVVENSKIISGPQREAIQKILHDLPTDNVLIHGDYHPGNIAMTERGAVVMDWLTAKQENAHADVANTVMTLRFAAVPGDNPELIARVNAIRQQFLEIYQQRYMELRPETNWDEVEQWMVPIIAGRLELNIGGERDNLLKELNRRLNRAA